jgi:hypothetical protein
MNMQLASHGRGTERRRFPRWSWKAELQGIYVDSEGRKIVEMIQAVDISKGGLGAITRDEHDVGQHFVIGLPQPNGRTRYVHAKVVRCWNDQNGQHVGMKFSDIPADLGHWLNIRLAA